MKDRGMIVGGLPGRTGYAEMAAAFITEAERIAALGLPEDPAEAAAAALDHRISGGFPAARKRANQDTPSHMNPADRRERL
jgi:hypothetical protein